MGITDKKLRHLNIENVRRAPRKPGVYALYADRTLLFLGMASGGRDTIRGRLRGHLTAGALGATHYRREPAREPKARFDALLSEYVAAHGSPPANNVQHA